ncbi:hypothetical protein ASZ90_019438 [hydrocarbon metagenome]|uniref:Uncharacterized protein n=1 Tax=hydrocarbon metagenome TaxID=938273 RepID=A0A0W8E3M3_9ZZZZ
MAAGDEDRKRIYDETASLIADLGIRGRITIEEMKFLLDLLELVLIKKDKRKFIKILKHWNPGQGDEEIDQIIKATLLTNDLNDFLSADENQEMIGDLINEKHKNEVR